MCVSSSLIRVSSSLEYSLKIAAIMLVVQALESILLCANLSQKFQSIYSFIS